MSLDLSWKAKSGQNYPRVWKTFQAKDLDNETLVEYRIVDLPEDRFEEVFRNFVDDFLTSEPVCVALGMNVHVLHSNEYI